MGYPPVGACPVCEKISPLTQSRKGVKTQSFLKSTDYDTFEKQGVCVDRCDELPENIITLKLARR
jgi:hypothetical protein